MNTTLTQFEKFLEQSKPLVEQYGREMEYDNLSNLLKEGAKQELTLMVCGEFKRGKSSFVNALLGQDLCPVAEGIATSAVSIIRYGEKERAVRHYSELAMDENNEEKLVIREEDMSFDQITRFAKGTTDEIGNTMFIELEVHNSLLKDGLVIIDTPGVGSLDPRHLFLTMQALPKADAFFFVTDTGEPMTTTELDFIKSRLVPTNNPFDVLLSKSDQVSKEELNRYKTDTENKLMICCSKKVDCIPVSSTEWEEFNKTGNERRRVNSNSEAVFAAINTFKTRRESIYAEAFRKQFCNLLDQIVRQAQETLATVQASNEADVTELQQKLVRMRSLKDKVTNDNSELRAKINSILKDSQEKVMREFSEESVLLSTVKLDKILKSPEAAKKGGEGYVKQQVNDSIRKLSTSLDDKINKAMNEVMSELGQYVETSLFVATVFDGTVNPHISQIEHTFSEKFVNSIRQSLPFMGVSLLVGSIVSWPVGIAAGLYYVVQSIIGSKKQERITYIRQQIAPRISITINELRSHIQKRYTELQEEAVNSLKSLATSMNEQMQATIQLMQECQQNNQKKASKVREIQSEITLMENLTTQVKVYGVNRFAKK